MPSDPLGMRRETTSEKVRKKRKGRKTKSWNWEITEERIKTKRRQTFMEEGRQIRTLNLTLTLSQHNHEHKHKPGPTPSEGRETKKRKKTRKKKRRRRCGNFFLSPPPLVHHRAEHKASTTGRAEETVAHTLPRLSEIGAWGEIEIAPSADPRGEKRVKRCKL